MLLRSALLALLIVFAALTAAPARAADLTNNFVNVAANGTTTVKSGQGTLVALCVNTKGASANTVTVYDNTAGSGTKLATVDTTTAIQCLPYDATFAVGLTVVVATGTAADLTVVYR